MEYKEVLTFWFSELTEAQWFERSDVVDKTIRERFSRVHQQAAANECSSWRETAQGRLAEIIVLDQFSRNLFRDDPRAFAQDPHSLCLSQELVSLKLDQELNTKEKAFAYMPYMHSESLLIHQEAKRLFAQEGLENNYKFELLHEKIIKDFGRYPHRNKVLGRPSTKEEIEFLNQPNSSF